MGVQQLSQPPVWSSLPSCLDSLPFTLVFVPKAGRGNFVGSGVVVVRLPPHVPESSVSPPPLWKWCAHLGTSSFVAADAQFECVSLPLHSRTALPPLDPRLSPLSQLFPSLDLLSAV